MKLGKFEIKSIDTCNFGLDGGSMFGVVPKAIWAKAYHPGDELNRITLAASPLFIDTGDRKILIDTGNGDKFDDKFAGIYNLNREESSLINALKKNNINPDDISDVILTHLHFDHAGGATVKSGNDIIPSFPNAKYYVQKDHLLWANNPTEKDRASFIKDNWEPLIQSNSLEIIEGEFELFPGISLILSDGHTKAMQLVRIESDSDILYFCADLMPTSAHIPFPFVMGYDNFPLTIIEERKKLIPRAFEENAILYFEHDAFKKAGRLDFVNNKFVINNTIEI